MYFSGQTLDEKTSIIWAEQRNSPSDTVRLREPRNLISVWFPLFRPWPAQGQDCVWPCSRAVNLSPDRWGLLCVSLAPLPALPSSWPQRRGPQPQDASDGRWPPCWSPRCMQYQLPHSLNRAMSRRAGSSLGIQAPERVDGLSSSF